MSLSATGVITAIFLVVVVVAKASPIFRRGEEAESRPHVDDRDLKPYLDSDLDREDAREARRERRALAREQLRIQKAALRKEHGPRTYLARWQIDYFSMGGELTRRVIRVERVQPNLRMVHGWCELRRDDRSFHLDLIQDAIDLSTGEVVDLEAWLSDYRRSRRKPRIG